MQTSHFIIDENPDSLLSGTIFDHIIFILHLNWLPRTPSFRIRRVKKKNKNKKIKTSAKVKINLCIEVLLTLPPYPKTKHNINQKPLIWWLIQLYMHVWFIVELNWVELFSTAVKFNQYFVIFVIIFYIYLKNIWLIFISGLTTLYESPIW